MGKILTRTVFVDGVAYGPASAIPAEVAERITNPAVWAEDVAAPAVPVGVVETAPAGPDGVGATVPDAESTVKELRDYARTQGITLGAAKTKEQILEVLGITDTTEGTDGDPETDDDTEAEDGDADAEDSTDD